MSLKGRLEELPLQQLLRVASRNQLTGRLTLTRRDGLGVIAFHRGRIVYAASNSARETVGNMLLLRRSISESVLLEALERQSRAPGDVRLGTILLEMEVVAPEELERVMREQVEKVLHELFTWRNGFIRFDAFAEDRQIEVDAGDLLVEDGLDTAEVVGAVLGRLESETDSRLERELQVLVGGAPAGPLHTTDVRQAARSPGLPSLKAIMAEIRSPTFTGEISLGILRYAGRVVRRGAIFLHSAHSIYGMGQFGMGEEADAADARVRGIRIPSDQPSVFLEVIEGRETFRGELDGSYWNQRLVERLGGPWPREVVAVPMVVRDRVVLVFYGDNAGLRRRIPSVEGLELLMIQGGLAIEKALLEERLQELEGRWEDGGTGPGGDG